MMANNKEIKLRGKLIRIAELKEEWDEDIEDPEAFVKTLKSSDLRADIFSFTQRLPESKPKYDYYMEWDSVAAIPITSYENWIKRQIAQNSRKKIGYAQRKGVTIKLVDFNDELVTGILDIYHETPILQGKPNRQYRTDFETAKKLNSTFLERAQFIGAFYKDELIAYIKLVSAGNFMRTMGILAKVAHREKGAMNLLIAKAVEICAERNLPYLTYSKFEYGKRGSETLQEFKRNLGFESIIVPRYFIPLNLWGKTILKLRLHRDLGEYLPKTLVEWLLQIRRRWYERKYAKESGEVQASV